MEKREFYLQLGFSFIVKAKKVKGIDYTDFTVLYHDIEIYHSLINRNWQGNADKLFVNICEGFHEISGN